MESKITVGGQALIEGVLMRSADRYALAVRTPEKKITVKTIPIKKSRFYNRIPVVRGVARFAETMYIGLQSLSYSAQISSGEDEKVNPFELYITLLLSIVMTVLLFYAAPLLVARFIVQSRGLLFNVVDGIVRLAIFLAYLFAISAMPDIRRMFQYHGAEHMTVHCYEKGEELTVKNIRKYATQHPRCGTSFLLIVFTLSILFFSFIPSESIIQRLGLRLLLLPVIAGVSYEFLIFAGKHSENPIMRFFTYPGLLLQKITTRKPDDSMIEVAVHALKATIK